MTDVTAAHTVLAEWQRSGFIPEGWDIDVEEFWEGGQPNGVGEIESSDSREWFSDERETHHRTRLEVTAIGPWESGARGWIVDKQRADAIRMATAVQHEEDLILAKAEAIRAAREAQA